MSELMTIGQVAERTGVSISAIRYYESANLVAPVRNNGGQRRFRRSDLRRISFILIAQQMGFSLEEIKLQMASLPENRTPTQRDWSKISKQYRQVLDERIAVMERMRERLDGCIGCGCLSLESCELYNPGDRAARLGSGPRYVLGDKDKPPDNPSD